MRVPKTTTAKSNKDFSSSRGSSTSTSTSTSTAASFRLGPVVEIQPTLEVAEEEDADEGEFDPCDYDISSCLDSGCVRWSVLEHEHEHGRRYHRYRHGKYPLPNDDVEQSRDHMKHVMHLEADSGQLFNAPIGNNPQRILDLGTGTGAWVIDVADKFPYAEVIGLDLSPIQPAWAPPNAFFRVDDVEDKWIEYDNFDFIHMRQLATFVKDTDKLLENCYNHLKPGGWIEVSDFSSYALSDDDSLPDDYPISQMFGMMGRALSMTGRDVYVADHQEEKLKKAGFINIQCRIRKTPIGPWPKDKTQRLVGMYFRTALIGLIEAMGSKVMRSLGLGDGEIDAFVAMARTSLENSEFHAYSNYLSWWGQKPAKKTVAKYPYRRPLIL